MAATKSMIIFLFFFIMTCRLKFSISQSWIKAGNWYAGSDFPISEINSALFTHLICAFANVDSSTYQLSIPSANEQYFSSFSGTIRGKSPSVTTLLSIWNGQNATSQSILGKKVNYSVLSSMVSDLSHRKSFIESSIKTAKRYGFQGIDLFWLWPNGTDLNNMGRLLDEWRAAITSDARNSSEPELILTAAVRYIPNHETVSYPIESMKRNLDWAHVVAYDYFLPSRDNVTGTHAALYNPASNISTDFGINNWLSRGFPANKLVLGVPYHGYAWTLANPNDKAIGAPASGPAITIDGSIGYKLIRAFIQNYGYGAASAYNATYAVNVFTIGATWINFDGVETIRAKIAYAKEKKLLGYNAFQLSNDDNWALSLAEKENQENRRRLLLTILLPIASVFILTACMICYFQRKVIKIKGSIFRSRRSITIPQNHESNAPNLQVFSFASIKDATNNFSNANKLGEGGFGPVYKGQLHGNQEIAVKRLATTSTQGLEEFENEVSLTARLQHVNLLRVLGYCIEREEKMLIYEYMPNKSLDKYLFDPIRGYVLDWQKRVNIIEGVTQGLLYLQEYSNFTIIHRDVKSSNILLDAEMNPKISDFGMARLFNKDVCEANTGKIVGTYGYIPPEYARKGIYSMKYDVYSFGVLLLQIISGKRNTCYYGAYENLNLLEYAYELWKGGIGMEFIDPSLDDSSSSCKIMRCMQVALLCVQENPVERPSMLEVFSMLKTETMAIPTPKKPAFSVNRDENIGSSSTSRQEVYSFNDSQLSELEPR
ncbi:cysteine-rich receptor-like protein kinase 7 isoform X2 [Pistacia vera]|uniref:cysteine-rich receptor-like protein kinase 7 isoform X2 n=1 Tax=Pistacia vera TaxID=55513 RepID=UPI001262B329|nr:cysteine-rich receptor-like protein kinase 7 isoform X2 [Pistacia vera]